MEVAASSISARARPLSRLPMLLLASKASLAPHAGANASASRLHRERARMKEAAAFPRAIWGGRRGTGSAAPAVSFKWLAFLFLVF